MKRSWLLALFIPFFCTAILAAPLGNPKAPKGGNIVVGMPAYPKSLLFYLAWDVYSQMIDSFILEPLIEFHPDTYEPIPRLASSWTISKDKKQFTFKINPQARFSDGKPVTAQDVKFTWDTIHNPKHKSVPVRTFFNSIESCSVIDKQTVVFKAKTIHFENLSNFTALSILPQHFFSKGNFNKAFNKKLLGSGPYTIKLVKRGDKVVLRRNPKYWGASLEQNLGRYNFDQITFKAVNDFNVQYEMFKRGDIDYYTFFMAKQWATETDGPLFKKGQTKKLKVENLNPFSTQGIFWNMRRPLFKDRRVRLALSHLQNRARWIKELFYNQYIPATGIVHPHSKYHSKKVKPVPYNPKEARRLLKEAGWTKTASDGVLLKGKKRFEFELLINNPGYLRFLTMYQQDLKQMGIKMNIRNLDWTTSLKLVDDQKFDAFIVARTRSVHPANLAVVWGSKSADMKGGANIGGYKNPEIDKLAQQIDETFSQTKRLRLVHRFEEIIARDQPMSFAWDATYQRVAYWNKFSFPKKGYFNYSTWETLWDYWWYDKKKAAKLKKGRRD